MHERSTKQICEPHVADGLITPAAEASVSFVLQHSAAASSIVLKSEQFTCGAKFKYITQFYSRRYASVLFVF